VKGRVIGLVRHFHEKDNPVSPATLKGIEDAAKVFRDLGAGVREVTLPSLAELNACGWVILLAEAYAVHEHWMRTRPQDYGKYMRERLMLAAALSAADYLQAQKRRADLVARTIAATEGVDFLLTASQQGEAPRIDAVPQWAFLAAPGFTMPFNVLGWPGISLCSGFGEGGLPVALQLVAKPWQEPALLAAAHAYEQATEWRKRRPGMTEAV
jgi:aspartyl-tRNA(Asn)/glutamyl-tRNA(Gln) amidotransferase subunit A